MWIFAAVTVGGSISGPIGMLLSVPISSIAYTLVKEATQNRERKLAKKQKQWNEGARAVRTVVFPQSTARHEREHQFLQSLMQIYLWDEAGRFDSSRLLYTCIYEIRLNLGRNFYCFMIDFFL